MSARGGGKKPAQPSRKNSEDMGTKEGATNLPEKKTKEPKAPAAKGGAKSSAAPKKNPKK